MATNRVFHSGKTLQLVVPSPTVSNDPVAIGSMAGVALTDYDADNGGRATVDFDGVYDLSVKAINGGGNSAVAIGDRLYYVSGDTPPISKKSTGVPIGYALEAISNGGDTATIQVRLGSW